jgi:glycosyltransferase involved in cell wall biosynthesis
MVIIAPAFSYNYEYAEIFMKISRNKGLDKYVDIRVKDLNLREKICVYKSSSMFLYPSLVPSAIDPPLTVLEAMSVGAKVLAYPYSSSLAYILKDGYNGYTFKSLRELFAKLVDVLNSRDNAVRINAMETIRNYFSLEKLEQQLKILHGTLMEST